MRQAEKTVGVGGINPGTAQAHSQCVNLKATVKHMSKSWQTNQDKTRQPEAAVFIMELPDDRVAHVFGPHPERGRLLPGASVSRPAGVQWKRRGIVTDNGGFVPIGEPELHRVLVPVKPIVRLKHITKNTWQVSVMASRAKDTREWLEWVCQPKPPRETRKRKHHPRDRNPVKLDYVMRITKIDRGFR